MYPIIEINIDTKSVERYLNEIHHRQIPFATANAMNLTMNDAQIEVRRTAYPAAFTQRNSSLAKSLTTIPTKFRATKQNLEVHMVNVRDSRTGRMAGEGFIERQIEGKVKTPKGTAIAIPVIGPGLRRLKGGSVKPNKKPRVNAKLYKAGNKLYERRARGKSVERYNLVKRARPSRKGKYKHYTVAERTILRNFETRWIREMKKAIRTAR